MTRIILIDHGPQIFMMVMNYYDLILKNYNPIEHGFFGFNRYLRIFLHTIVIFRLTPYASLHTPLSILLTPHSILLTPYSSLLTPYSSLHTPHSILHTPHSILLIPHSILLTPYSKNIKRATIPKYKTPASQYHKL